MREKTEDIQKDIRDELNSVQVKIKNIKNTLKEYEEKENSLKSKLNAPDLVGKYIHNKVNIYDYYMKIESIYLNQLDKINYIAQGQSINVTTQLKGINYTLQTYDVFCVSKGHYEVITKEEYDKIFETAIKQFIK